MRDYLPSGSSPGTPVPIVVMSGSRLSNTQLSKPNNPNIFISFNTCQPHNITLASVSRSAYDAGPMSLGGPPAPPAPGILRTNNSKHYDDVRVEGADPSSLLS